MIEVISIGSDNIVRLDALTNASSGASINNATVTYTLKDSSGTIVLSNQTMTYVAASNGRYEGTIPQSAWIHGLVKYGGRREHRTVTLPDYQGVGIGMAVSSFCAALYSALGQRATSTTSHPAFIAARRRSKDWRMIRDPSLG